MMVCYHNMSIGYIMIDIMKMNIIKKLGIKPSFFYDSSIKLDVIVG